MFYEVFHRDTFLQELQMLTKYSTCSRFHSSTLVAGWLAFFHILISSLSNLLSLRYHHRNILSLVAYSNDGHRPCLIYEYMENGSLADCLRGRQSVPLSWEVRLSIADQIADALHFLHTVNHPKCLVHGDVKRSVFVDVLTTGHQSLSLSDHAPGAPVS